MGSAFLVVVIHYPRLDESFPTCLQVVKSSAILSVQIILGLPGFRYPVLFRCITPFLKYSRGLFVTCPEDEIINDVLADQQTLTMERSKSPSKIVHGLGAGQRTSTYSITTGHRLRRSDGSHQRGSAVANCVCLLNNIEGPRPIANLCK